MTAEPLVPDVVGPGLRVVFCGTALSAVSAEVGAPYAGPGNKFWPTLHEAGFTPHRLAPAEFREVVRWGIGLTDLNKTDSGSDAEIGDGGYDLRRLRSLLEKHRPDWIAFTSKKAAQTALEMKSVEYGPREEPFAGVRAFVLPSPSGRASGHWDIGPWRSLAELANA